MGPIMKFARYFLFTNLLLYFGFILGWQQRYGVLMFLLFLLGFVLGVKLSYRPFIFLGQLKPFYLPTFTYPWKLGRITEATWTWYHVDRAARMKEFLSNASLFEVAEVVMAFVVVYTVYAMVEGLAWDDGFHRHPFHHWRPTSSPSAPSAANLG